MARCVLSPRAQADIDQIWDYTADQWSVAQAENYIRIIERAINTIARYPGRGRACDDIRPGYFKFRAGSHVLFYRHTRGRVDVVRVLHQRMDFDKHL